MIPQSTVGTQQRPLPQRVPSTGPHRPLNRPTLPSKLSNVTVLGPGDNRDVAAAAASATLAAQQQQQQQQSGGVKQEQTSVKAEAVGLDNGSHGLSGSGDYADTLTAIPSTGTTSNSLLEDGQQTPATTTSEAPVSLQKAISLPLPRRPTFLTEPVKIPSSNPSSVAPTGRRDPARRSNGLQAPAIATALPRGKAADFFPWTGIPGAHAEDVYTEQVIKTGYVDKPAAPPPAQESNIGRPAIWPALRKQGGLSVLSMLFCQVMERRGAMGRCTAPSTFKPPPRVTLTDTKREMWLKDLSNPEVPLRKLSRTIPHGIRGKILLDHCINKDIPLARAIWLAKCVGANELRAFKRKGISGSQAMTNELKWIREWSVFVEQFIEGVIDMCGRHPGWNAKMQYAIRLAAHLFTDQLLDTDHYLDWVLSSLATSTSERLPIWLLLVQIYWKHLVSQRSRGRRLAEALIAHTQQLAAPQCEGTNARLVVRLEQLINILAISHQACLVMPGCWNKYKNSFKAIKAKETAQHATGALLHVARRNGRLVTTPSASTTQSPKLQLIGILDSAGVNLVIEKLAVSCQIPSLDTQTMTLTTLQWACSRHREGVSKMFIASQLLRHWNLAGANTDGAILIMLEEVSNNPNYDPHALHTVIASLARAGCFSVGRYLQWLISMGALSDLSSAPGDAQLLLELPLDNLAPNVFNLRRSLLQRMGYRAETEVSELEKWKMELSNRLNNAAALSMGSEWQSDFRALAKPTGAIATSVARWLCDAVVKPAPGPTGIEPIFFGDVASFCLVRGTLEYLEDYTSLARVAEAGASQVQPRLLATVCDTVNMHAEVFAALGALPALTSRLCKQQRFLRTRQPLDRTFVLALMSLAKRVPCDATFITALAADVGICEQQTPISACSPASDSMVVGANGALESDNDVDRVLQSGNTMDEKLMERMINNISDRAAKMGVQGISRSAGWYSQLRQFERTTFDQLIQRVMLRLIENAAHADEQQPQHAHVVVVTTALVGAGCMQLDLAIRILGAKVSAYQSQPLIASKLARICLELMVPSEASPTGHRLQQSPEAYHMRLEQLLYSERKRGEILSLLGVILRDSSNNASTRPNVLAFLRRTAVSDAAVVSEKLVAKSDSATRRAAQQLFTILLNPNASSVNFCELPPDQAVSTILSYVNELSLPFCTLALGELTSNTVVSASLECKDRLISAFEAAIESDLSVWPQLLTAMDAETIAQIHSWAQERAITCMSTLISSTTSSDAQLSAIKRYLRAQAATSSVCQPGSALIPQQPNFTLVIEQLRALSSLLDGLHVFDISQATQRQRINFGLDVLLQVTARLYQSLSDASGASIDLAPLVVVLCMLLTHSNLQTSRPILEYLLDVTAMLSDELSAEAVQYVLRSLPAQTKADARVKWIFGIHDNPDSRLLLATKISATAQTQQNTASATSAAQSLTSLRTPPASAGLPPRPGSALGQQRPTSQQGVQPQTSAATSTPNNKGPFEIKTQPFMLRRWEMMPDPTPNMGANDTSLSLGLFQARRVV